MQRQKTIAKWLAIILLLTAAVGAYLTVSAVTKGKKAAGDSGVGAGDNVQTGKPSEDDVHIPVYSKFPREGVTLDGIGRVAHVGGEEDELLLNAVYFNSKWILFFDSASLEYDVREKGLHIAVLDGDALEKVISISEGESYLASALTFNGLMLLTYDSESTRARLFDSDLNVVGEKLLPRFVACRLAVADTLKIYAYDNLKLIRYDMSPSLEYTASNFQYPIKGLEGLSLYSTGGTDIIVLQSEDAVNMLTYTPNEGFKRRYTIDKQRVVQIMPHTSDGAFILLTLTLSDEGLTLYSFDPTLKVNAQASFSDKSAAMIKDGANIKVVTPFKVYTLCSHLMQEGEEDVTADIDIGEIRSDNGEILIALSDGKYSILELDGSDLDTIISLSGISSPMVFSLQEGLRIFFSGNIASMSFGKNDIFSLSLLT